MSGTLPIRGLFARREGRRTSGCRTLRLEALETRTLLSVSVAGVASTTLMYAGHAAVSPAASPPSGSLTPSQIRQAYGINNISFNGVAGDGTGTTIAIVDAYNAPNIVSDVAAFSSYFSLPACNLTVVNQTGGSTLPKNPPADDDWDPEISLDVEWAHAIAPGAKILLVEATNDQIPRGSSIPTDLFDAVNYACGVTGVVVVSMSWGQGEFSGESSYDSNFVHAGVTFVAASGDSGSPPIYPAISPDVVSVGGTSLSVDSNGNRTSETGATFSGGGISGYGQSGTFESQPSYQSSYAISQNNSILLGATKRCNPDVSLVASNVPFYDSYDFTGGWAPTAPPDGYYGTSFAAPQWAALIAIADQGRALAGLGSLSSAAALADLYLNIPASSFYDITSINSTSGTTTVGSPEYSCGTGYNLVTGLGVPVANLLAPALVYSTAPGTPVLAAAYDTGVSNSDDITDLNNSSPSAVLQFSVPNTVSGATVTLYSGGTLIGTATATGATTTVTTSGSFTLTNGSHAITAEQTVPGLAQSSASAALSVTIDTTPPKVTNVVIGSNLWSTSFLTYLTTLSGKNVGGYSVPVGSGDNCSRCLG